jgi:hypothetical protein
MKNSNKIKIVVLFAGTALLASVSSFAQKVANYSYGKYGTPRYEHFSFSTNAGKRAEISYTYGKDGKEVAAKYIGTGVYKQKKCFKVELAGKNTLYIVPAGQKLQVANPNKNYNKVFNWEYEGPVNGVGTFCDVCAEDEKEAIGIINRWFIK